MIDSTICNMLRTYAEQYETKDFLIGDPSWFMHQFADLHNQETTAFVASVLSYGSRKQFLPKIQSLLDASGGDIYGWILSNRFTEIFHDGDTACFYRLYTKGQMAEFFRGYKLLLQQYGSIGDMLRKSDVSSGLSAVEHICRWFAEHGSGGVVPKNAQSCCKRLCMFLRWMVRSGSPVDLGLWSDFIDRRTLIIPMDTHVLQEAMRLGLIHSRTASMCAALQLTKTLADVFPDDPLAGDFALFGYGVNSDKKN
ncbi:MAG: TIGR02757 family protein [Paludibacteraceae bacterium]|nr:TIGR02757 family protein [Paludibacteraceae bacterium]